MHAPNCNRKLHGILLFAKCVRLIRFFQLDTVVMKLCYLFRIFIAGHLKRDLCSNRNDCVISKRAISWTQGCAPRILRNAHEPGVRVDEKTARGTGEKRLPGEVMEKNATIVRESEEPGARI